MRAYVPVGWPALAALHRDGQLPGPHRACSVDPAWRAGDPAADEEEWEYEAQQAAADMLAAQGGVILALDVEPPTGAALADGWFDLAATIRRTDIAAVLTAELAWFGAQEVPALLAGSDTAG